MGEHRLVADDELNALAREGPEVVRDIAFELVRARRTLRQDSRRAEQLRKLRWSIESVHAKVEKLAEREKVEGETIADVIRWLEGYEDEDVSPAILIDGLREGRWR